MKSNRSLLIVLSILVFLMMVGLPVSGQDTDQLTMEKAVLTAFFEAEANRDYEAMRALFMDDFTRHSVATLAVMPDVYVSSFEDYTIFLQETAAMFPDYRNELLLVAAEGDYVGFCTEFAGTFVANGRALEIPIMGFVRFEGEKIAEMWVEWDNLSWNAQMGITDVQVAEGLRPLIEDLWVNHNPDALDRLLTSNAVSCRGLTEQRCGSPSNDSRKDWLEQYWAAFPSMTTEILGVTVEGRKVFVEMRFGGVFENAFDFPITDDRIEPTNRYERWSMMWILTLGNNGPIAIKEQWLMHWNHWAVRPRGRFN